MSQISPEIPEFRQKHWYDEFVALTAAIIGQGNANDAIINTGRLSVATLDARFAGKQDAGSYAAAVHSHGIADVATLQAALDGKSATGHTHTIANVTGLQTALDGKQAVGSYATATHGHAIGDVTNLQSTLDSKVDKTMIELKGDLLVGSANDTISRLAAGNDGQVLTFDGATATGLKWAAPTGGGGSSAWGGITGTLSNQTDLQTALNAKNKFIVGIGAPTAGEGNNGDYYFDKTSGNLHFKSGGAWASETAFIAERAPLASPTFTGDPKAPTPATADNDTSIATTAFVKAQSYAPLASPTLTGTPAAPTASVGTNTTQLATTAFVQTAAGLLVPKSLVDAKGDLLAGTANDTVGRLAVGTNGQVLTADSAETTGMKWATPSGGGSGPSNVAYLWRNPAGIVSGNVRVGAVTKDGDERWLYQSSGTAFFYPAYYESTFGVNGLGVSLRGSDAAATIHCSLYTAHGTSGLPNTVVATGTVSGASSGWKNIDITAVTGLAAGWYWHSILPVGGSGLDIHGGWMIHPMDASNMENGIRHNHWNGFKSVSTALSSPPTLPSIERVGSIIPYMTVRFN